MPRPASASTAAAAALDLRCSDRRSALRDAVAADRCSAPVDRALDARSVRSRTRNQPARATAPFGCAMRSAAATPPSGDERLHLRADRLPAVAQPADGQRDGGGGCRCSCRCNASSSRSKVCRSSCKTVDQVKATLNPELTIHGIVLTMYDARNNLSDQVVADVRAIHGPTRSTTPSSRATCGFPKRRRTASRCWSTISNASAAKPICGSRPKSSSARRS